VKAGTLRQVIDIESPTESRSPSGAIAGPPWNNFATVRAEIKTVEGREAFAGDEFLAQATHTVTIRYLAGVTQKMRINFKTQSQRDLGQDGRLFDILAMNDIDERHREIDLTCREAVRGHGL
jgi:SPP1 family predicted phage head-tail adaptor